MQQAAHRKAGGTGYTDTERLVCEELVEQAIKTQTGWSEGLVEQAAHTYTARR